MLPRRGFPFPLLPFDEFWLEMGDDGRESMFFELFEAEAFWVCFEELMEGG